ncbi:MAG: putative molibdopterin-dependent oxidoreductase YjgC [Oceanospirillaceae bacterium]|jgi:predicted molibdopterin-dependent oxidoreductase YjgC
MKNDFTFKRLSNSQNTLSFFWQDQSMCAQEGDTIASALISAGIQSNSQSLITGSPRGPFCMMGSCFECTVEVDGQILQACIEPIKEGMRVNSPRIEPIEESS